MEGCVSRIKIREKDTANHHAVFVFPYFRPQRILQQAEIPHAIEHTSTRRPSAGSRTPSYKAKLLPIKMREWNDGILEVQCDGLTSLVQDFRSSVSAMRHISKVQLFISPLFDANATLEHYTDAIWTLETTPVVRIENETSEADARSHTPAQAGRLAVRQYQRGFSVASFHPQAVRHIFWSPFSVTCHRAIAPAHLEGFEIQLEVTLLGGHGQTGYSARKQVTTMRAMLDTEHSRSDKANLFKMQTSAEGNFKRKDITAVGCMIELKGELTASTKL